MVVVITGTLGAGKGTVKDYLVNTYKFSTYSVREFISEYIRAEGNPVNRDTLTEMGNRLRQKDGMFIFKELLKRAQEKGGDVVIESLRAPEEFHFMEQQEGVYIWGVDADIEIRYTRVLERASETDRVSFDVFKQNEAREMDNTNPKKQNLRYCISRVKSEFLFWNNGDFNALYAQVDAAILTHMLK